jgi:opacity protein-like surface antigen
MYKSVITIVFMCLVFVYAGDNPKDYKKPLSAVKTIKNDNIGLYVGIFTGWMRLEDSYTKEYFETIPIGLQIGYKFNPYLSLEGRYMRDVGKVSYDGGNTTSQDSDDFDTTFSNLAIFLKPQYSYESYVFYALLGYGEVSLSDIKGADRSEDGFEWGVGMAYGINKNISLFIDYISAYNDKGFGGRATDRDVSVDSISLGVNYEF